MPAAIPAAIGAAGAIGGGLLAKSGAKSAAKAASADNAANNALQKEIYQQNTANLDPFMQRGNVAGDTINALLGLPTYQAPANNNAPQGQPIPGGFSGMSLGGFAGDPFRGIQRQPTPQQQIPVGTVQAGITPQGANDSFRGYIDNSDYAFRQNEGNRGLNAGYAANGLLESGAAMKAMEKYRENLQSGYRNEYLGHLGNQQGVGLSGANALAGVGTNYANAVNSNNMAATGAKINAGLVGSSAMGQGIAGAAGAIGNALGSSYGNTPGTFGGYNYANAGQSLMNWNPNA